jgi:hypothetical protein
MTSEAADITLDQSLLEETIVTVLPKLIEAKVISLCDRIVELGPQVLEDIKWIQEKDISPPRSVLEARKFIAAMGGYMHNHSLLVLTYFYYSCRRTFQSPRAAQHSHCKSPNTVTLQ